MALSCTVESFSFSQPKSVCSTRSSTPISAAISSAARQHPQTVGLRHLTLRGQWPRPQHRERRLHAQLPQRFPSGSPPTTASSSPNPKLLRAPRPPAPRSHPGVQTATLQGWSVVDNTTGADWINVQLSLIAGAPQSFIQPLSVPYYSRRPEIGLPQEAQLTPQTHESGEEDAKDNAAPPAPAMATCQIDGLRRLLRERATEQRSVDDGRGSGSGSGMGPGSGGNSRWWPHASRGRGVAWMRSARTGMPALHAALR